MGGAQAGEVASRLAAAVLNEGTLGDLEGNGLGEARLAELIQEANRRVYQRSNEDAAASGMGTTMTVALVDGDAGTVAIGHVGDSRAYRVRDGELEQLTEDHSLVNELLKSGRLSPEEALSHPQRSVITRAIGTEPDVDVDTFTVDAQSGDLFLLCSDGLTDMITDEEILGLVERSERRSRDRSAPSGRSREPKRRRGQHHGRRLHDRGGRREAGKRDANARAGDRGRGHALRARGGARRRHGRPLGRRRARAPRGAGAGRGGAAAAAPAPAAPARRSSSSRSPRSSSGGSTADRAKPRAAHPGRGRPDHCDRLRERLHRPLRGRLDGVADLRGDLPRPLSRLAPRGAGDGAVRRPVPLAARGAADRGRRHRDLPAGAGRRLQAGPVGDHRSRVLRGHPDPAPPRLPARRDLQVPLRPRLARAPRPAGAARDRPDDQRRPTLGQARPASVPARRAREDPADRLPRGLPARQARGARSGSVEGLRAAAPDLGRRDARAPPDERSRERPPPVRDLPRHALHRHRPRLVRGRRARALPARRGCRLPASSTTSSRG